MAMAKKDIEDLLKKDFPEAEISIKDLVGDQDHYELIIKSQKLAGLSRVKQHQMIYKTLGDKMGTTLHALSIKVVSN